MQCETKEKRDTEEYLYRLKEDRDKRALLSEQARHTATTINL